MTFTDDIQRIRARQDAVARRLKAIHAEHRRLEETTPNPRDFERWDDYYKAMDVWDAKHLDLFNEDILLTTEYRDLEAQAGNPYPKTAPIRYE